MRSFTIHERVFDDMLDISDGLQIRQAKGFLLLGNAKSKHIHTAMGLEKDGGCIFDPAHYRRQMVSAAIKAAGMGYDILGYGKSFIGNDTYNLASSAFHDVNLPRNEKTDMAFLGISAAPDSESCWLSFRRGETEGNPLVLLRNGLQATMDTFDFRRTRAWKALMR